MVLDADELRLLMNVLVLGMIRSSSASTAANLHADKGMAVMVVALVLAQLVLYNALA